MTALHTRPGTEVTRMRARSRFTEYVLGIMGVLAAAVGAWMYYVPADWFLGDLAEGWYFGLFVAAGVLLAAAFGIFARTAYVDDRELTTPVVLAALVALLALGGAITFAAILVV